MLTDLRRFRTAEDGASAVEFAIVLPILVLLVFGIIEFGLAYNHYVSITHAAREGVRQASVGKSDDVVRDKARMSAGMLAGDPNLQIIGPTYPEGDFQGKPVILIVQYPEQVAIPLFGTYDLTLSSTATMRVE